MYGTINDARTNRTRSEFSYDAGACLRVRLHPICPLDPAIFVRRLTVGLVLILVAIGLPRSPALADDASALIGRWLVPSREQEKSRMSPQCQQYAETDVQPVPASELEFDRACEFRRVKNVVDLLRRRLGCLFGIFGVLHRLLA